MQYVILHFLEDNTVEPVPTTWLNGNNSSCYCPPKKGSKLREAIKQAMDVNEETWEKFPVKVLNFGKYGLFLTVLINYYFMTIIIHIFLLF